MSDLDYNRWLTRLGFSFFTLLITHHTGLAKEGKGKEVAIVSPTIQEKSANAAHSNTGSKAKLPSDLETANALNRARLENQLATIIAQVEQLRLQKEHLRLSQEIEDENAQKEHNKAMLLLIREKERLVIELELANIKLMKQIEEHDHQLIKLGKKLELEKVQRQLLQETTHRLQAEMEALKTKAARDQHIQKKPIYLKDPLIKEKNILVLSDRCIDLNGLITDWKAKYIVDQIHYFNNKNSEWPIFLIIDICHGGPQYAGWNILQTIEYSKAPVYVVVKTYAASMAALITTLAPKSYVYPNAIILHHQPYRYTSSHCNLRLAREFYTAINEGWKRLGGRVAKKMGISLETFNKKLYEKSVNGDWPEYGDQAKKLKWVDYVINGVQHSAINSLPDPANYTSEGFAKDYWSCDKTKGGEHAAEEEYYHTLAPYDFDYSYRPDRKAQVMAKQ